METGPFQYMFCISFVVTWISNGCLVLVMVWVFIFFGFFQWRLSCVYKVFSKHTLVKDRIYTYFGPKKLVKKFANRKPLFNLFLFWKLSYYKTISGNLAKSDNTPKQHFVYKMSVFPKIQGNLQTKYFQICFCYKYEIITVAVYYM